MPLRATSRRTGAEMRALAWLVRHPLFALVPAALVLGMTGWSTRGTLVVTGGLVLAVVVWWRAHPASFDRFAAPRLRAGWRRWTRYRGRRWARLLADVELTKENRRTGVELVPRVTRVRSATPSIDTVYVRMVRGQDVRTWLEQAPTLADALRAHRVAVTRLRPGLLAVVVEHTMPFTRPLDAPVIPERVEDVDPRALDVGDTETGAPFRLNLRGKHFFVAGGSGSGKGSLLYGPLRALGPWIREGLVELWVIDLKGGTETERGAPLFTRWATTMREAIELLTGFRDAMITRQEEMRAARVRQNTITTATPWRLLIIDEMAMATAYGDRTSVRTALQLLAEILTQGRAADHTVAGYVQEPTKDVVDIRDLFTVKAALAVTAASHVDMALGDGARERGALADEIPIDPEFAGIGFVIDPRTRAPIRFRAGMVTDADIDDLVTRCTPGTPAVINGEVLPFPVLSHADHADAIDDSTDTDQEDAS